MLCSQRKMLNNSVQLLLHLKGCKARQRGQRSADLNMACSMIAHACCQTILVEGMCWTNSWCVHVLIRYIVVHLPCLHICSSSSDIQLPSAARARAPSLQLPHKGWVGRGGVLYAQSKYLESDAFVPQERFESRQELVLWCPPVSDTRFPGSAHYEMQLTALGSMQHWNTGCCLYCQLTSGAAWTVTKDLKGTSAPDVPASSSLQNHNGHKLKYRMCSDGARSNDTPSV